MMNKPLWIVSVIIWVFGQSAGVAEAQIPGMAPLPQRGQKQSVLPTLQDGSPAAFIRISLPVVRHGLTIDQPENSPVQTDVFMGFQGVFPAENSETGQLFLKANTDQLVTATGTFYVEVQYFDQGQGNLELTYQAKRGNEEGEPRSHQIILGNSGHWQRHTFTLENAVLDHSFSKENDFVITGPNIPIRQVALSRSPLSPTDQVVSPMFNQPRAPLPPGFFAAVVPEGGAGSALWKEENVLQGKAKLYRSWGADHVVDTLQNSNMKMDGFRIVLEGYAERARRLSKAGLTWLPRIEVGHPQSLPGELIGDMQRARALKNPGESQSISMWEPQLVEAYTRLFQAINQSVPFSSVPYIVVSLSTMRGPLIHEGGWSDVWAGDPLARQDFFEDMRQQYSSINAVSRFWQKPLRSWKQVVPAVGEEAAPAQALDTQQFYQRQFAKVAEKLLQAVRRLLPSSTIILEVGADYYHGAAHPATLANLASRYGGAVLVKSPVTLPARTSMWPLLGNALREQNIQFGLRLMNGGSAALTGAFYSLASEGGTMFVFEETQMTQEGVWETYLQTVRGLRIVQPQRRVAVVFPETAAAAYGPEVFERKIQQLRDLFAFDVIAESQLGQLNASQHPLIFVPWGHLWSREGVQSIERLAREGAAVMVYTDKVWRTLEGDTSFNERLFHAKVEQTGKGLRYVPRTSVDEMPANTFKPQRQIIVDMASPNAMPYLDGGWSLPQRLNPKSGKSVPFETFRWLEGRGSLSLSLIPDKSYTLYIEGFLPPNQMAEVALNGKPIEEIHSQGAFVYKKDMTGLEKPKRQQVQITMQVTPSTTNQDDQASPSDPNRMAVSRVAMLPHGKRLDASSAQPVSLTKPDFRREALRGSWLKEVGRGVTVLAPKDYLSDWVFMELLNAAVQNPKMMDPRFEFTLPVDGKPNGVFVSPSRGGSLYLNMNDQPVRIPVSRRHNRTVELPALSIFFR